MKDRDRKIQSVEDRVKAKEKSLSQKIEEASRKEKSFQRKETDLDSRIHVVELKHKELEKIQQKELLNFLI